MPVILFFVVIAGMFSAVLLPVNIEIYGTVTDDEGNPLEVAHMVVRAGDQGFVAQGGVDSQGSFSITLHHYGEYEVWAGTPGYQYWEQVQVVEFESQHKNIRQRMDLQLTPNIPCNVTLLASYWSVNSTHTSVAWGYAQRGTITTQVEVFDRDGPFNEDVTYETYGRIEGSGYSEGGHVLLNLGVISGYYSSAPGEVVACYFVENAAVGTSDVPAADYLAPNDAGGGWIEVVGPMDYREARVDVAGNYTLPDALSIPIDVDVLGIRYQTILRCTMLDPSATLDRYGISPSTLSVWVGVTNLDTVPHSYKFFVEGGHIIHVWELS